MIRLILWLLPDDPLSNQARVALESVAKVLPPELSVRVRQVTLTKPEVLRAPAYLLKDGNRVLARHEGTMTANEILELVKRHL
jgi:hypothetical protein